MYYLNTRFYIPEIGRYLSIDDISNIQLESIGGLNLFAYCYCNPIMYFDPNGNIAISTIIILVCIGIGAIAGGTIVYTIAKNKGETGWALFGWTLLGIVGGGVIGGIIGYFAAPAIASFLTSTFSLSIPTGLSFMATDAGVTMLAVTSSTTITISGATILETIGALSLGLTVMFTKNIVNQNDVRITDNYPIDHSPGHVHVSSKNHPPTRIGPNGYPLKGNRIMTPQENNVFWENIKIIRKVIKKAQKFIKRLPW